MKNKKEKGKFRQNYLNFSDWIHSEEIADNTTLVERALKKSIFSGFSKHKRYSSFSQIVEDQNLSEDELKEKMVLAKKYAIIYFLFACLILAYAVLLLVRSSFFIAAISAILTIFLFVNAYSMLLWHLQIKYRKIGFSFLTVLKLSMK